MQENCTTSVSSNLDFSTHFIQKSLTEAFTYWEDYRRLGVRKINVTYFEQNHAILA